MNEDDAEMVITRLSEIRDILDCIDNSIQNHNRDDLWLEVYIAVIGGHGGERFHREMPDEIAQRAGKIADAACEEYGRRRRHD